MQRTHASQPCWQWLSPKRVMSNAHRPSSSTLHWHLSQSSTMPFWSLQITPSALLLHCPASVSCGAMIAAIRSTNSIGTAIFWKAMSVCDWSVKKEVVNGCFYWYVRLWNPLCLYRCNFWVLSITIRLFSKIFHQRLVNNNLFWAEVVHIGTMFFEHWLYANL